MAVAIGLGLACILTAWVYQPGIGGVFLLDDLPNLSILTDFNQAPSWESARYILFNGIQGPFGRPLSLASFLAEASDWPDDPGRFRQTNLLLHISNGLLLFLLVFRVTHRIYRHAAWLALALSGLWLLHPLHTTTTLYIIQRMTLLAALFSLGGMWIYIVGRDLVSIGRIRLGILQMATGVWIGIGAGVLSKGNAILIPVFLIALEATVLAHSAPQLRAFRVSRAIILGLPVFALTVFLAYRWPDFQTSYLTRTFDLTERLLTEARVLIDYLTTILRPRLANISLFHDAYPVSRGLLSPPSTLLSIVLIITLLSTAYKIRLRYPVFAAGIFWFFGGHILESSVIPLELYFEHRNYLPSIGIIAIILYFLIVITRRFSMMITVLSILAIAGFFSWQTVTASRDWGYPVRAATIWPTEFPNSERAQQMAASIWIRAGQYQKAEQALTKAATRNQQHPLLWLQVAQMQCLQGLDPASAITKSILSKQTIAINKSDLDTLDSLRELVRQNRCTGVSPTFISRTIATILSLPPSALSDNNRAYARFIEAFTYADRGLIADAVRLLDVAIRFDPNFRYRSWQIMWLLSDNQPAAAQAYLTLAEQELHQEKTPDPLKFKELSTLKRTVDAARQHQAQIIQQ